MATDNRLVELLSTAWRLGVRPEAADDVRRRGAEFIAQECVLNETDDDLTDAQRTKWTEQLKASPHLFPAPTTATTTTADTGTDLPDWLSPAEKLSRHRQRHAAGGAAVEGSEASPRRRRVPPPAVPPELAAEWATLAPATRMQKYREWLATEAAKAASV